jgi:DeoR/GlpR family transcriptional regulator of sugar metabolism
MDVRNRRRLTLDALQRSGGEIRVAELAAVLNCSEMTIRRDLDALDREGVVRRVHGGAVSLHLRGDEVPYAVRALQFLDAKQRIGVATASLVADGETVVLDAGTTALEVARALRGRSVTVMPLGLRTLVELMDDDGVRMIVPGGEVRPGELSLIGDLAEVAFERLRFDTFVLGCCGIDRDDGVTAHLPDDARIKRAAMRASRRTIAVADSSKLARVTFGRVCDVSDLERLVTDLDADEAHVAALAAAGLEVSCV